MTPSRCTRTSPRRSRSQRPANQTRRRARPRLFATLIADRIEQEEIAKLTHWIRTVPARYLITALREVR